MARILLLGAYGLLGSSLSPHLIKCGHDVRRQGRNPLAQISIDPVDKGALLPLLSRENFDCVINLIAATNVDECEQDCLSAYQANVAVLEVLADTLGCMQGMVPHVIHISTDHVYAGIGPHSENKISPCNVYALSKAAGEIAARSFGATILRTNFVGKSDFRGRASFTDWLVKSLRARDPITLFDDVLFSPLHVSVLCEFIEKASQLKVEGTFNLGCSHGLSKAQFGDALAKRLHLDFASVGFGSVSDANLKAKRPQDMRLDVTKFEREFGLTVPDMEQTIDLVAQDYRNE